MRYAIELTPDDNDTMRVSVPDLPEVATFGDDAEDAAARAVDAIETALIGRIADRENIPSPRARDAVFAELSALTSAKIELYKAMRADGVGKAQLAKRLGVALPQIDRLLDLHHHSRVDALERAFGALGRGISIVAQAAAWSRVGFVLDGESCWRQRCDAGGGREGYGYSVTENW